MKKVLTVLSFILLLLIIGIILLPVIYKNKIKDYALETINSKVDATVSYDRFSLTLFQSFPDFAATFKGLAVVGKDVFANDTLVSIKEFSAQIDLSSLLKDDGILIKKIFTDGSKINMLRTKEGKSNWKITKPDKNENVKTTDIKTVDAEREPSKFLLQDIIMNDLSFVFDNRRSDFTYSILNANLNISGELKGMETILDFDINSPSMNFTMDGAKYIKEAPFSLKTSLLANLDSIKFIFDSQKSEINSMPLNVEGSFAYPRDSMIFDLKFDIPEIGLNTLFKMIPDEYKKVVEKADAKGKIDFNGIIKGVYYKDITPLINVAFNIENGTVKYPGLPDELKINEASAYVFKPEGNFDNLEIGVKKLNLNLAGNPIAMHAQVKSVTKDPNIDADLKGILDLGTLLKLFPVEGLKMSGVVDADASLKGNLSDIKENNYNNYVSEGKLGIKQFYVENKSLPKGITIPNANVELKNQNVVVSNLNGKIGRSDFSLNGKLDNFLSYLFKQGSLNGNFNLSSNLIDANEFLSDKDADSSKTGEGSRADSSKTTEKPIVFPKNTNLNFNARVSRLMYQKLDITNFAGSMQLKDQTLTLNGIGMNMLQGRLGLTGSVIADGRPDPAVNLNLDVKSFDLPMAFSNISLVEKFLPFAEKSQGKISTVLKLQSKLAGSLKMILSSVSASGSLSTQNVRMIDNSAFYSLKKVIQTDMIKNPSLKDFTVYYEIKDGNLHFKPFNTVFAGQPVSISGIYNLGGNLDFRIDGTVDRNILSSEIQKIIAYVPGHESITKIDLGLDIKGDIKKPDIRFDSDKIKNQVINHVKKNSKKEIKDQAKKILDKYIN